MSYSIGISTFSKRIDMLKELLVSIRLHRPTVPILIAINGTHKQKFDEDYRRNVLQIITEYQFVYPIFFPQMRGYAKLVNTLVVHSPEEKLVLLQDDTTITSHRFFDELEILLPKIDRMCRFNGSFSQGCYTKRGMIELGWFDERLLGFGEEDGDIIYRYIDKYGEEFPNYNLPDFINIVSDIRDENIIPGAWKYTLFNRQFIGFWTPGSGKYVHREDSRIEGMFGMPMTKVLDDVEQYPYEQFYLDNRDTL